MGYLNLPPDLQYLLGLAGSFAAAGLLGTGLYFLFWQPRQQRRQLIKRLQGGRKEKLAHFQLFKASQEDKKGLLITLVEQLFGWGKIANLQRTLLQGDIYASAGNFLSVVGILACLGFLLGMMKDNPLLGAGLAAGLAILPFFYLRLRKRRKTRRFEKQMPEAMELLSRSLRAGHTLPAALELLSQETPYPLGLEMRIVYEEQRLGLGLAAALRRLGERVASPDLRYFVTAVLIQTETGGNLAEIMENIGHIIRERLKLRGKIKSLTAEGRFSAIILGLLPVVVFGLLLVVNRQYILALWYDELGFRLLQGGIISIFIGAVWMKRMVQIRV